MILLIAGIIDILCGILELVCVYKGANFAYALLGVIFIGTGIFFARLGAKTL